MPIYNVTATTTTTMVVIAESEAEARLVAADNVKQAYEDACEPAQLSVTGEVTHERHLRDGWDADCVPYGGDRNTRLRDLLPNA